MSVSNPRAFDGLKPFPVQAGAGIVEAPSRFDAPPGSLSQTRNWEVVNGAYEETQGLTIVGPTIDTGLRDFWHASLSTTDALVTGTLQTGDILYWYAEDGITVAGSGRMYYADGTGNPIKITLDQVTGATPRRAVSFYTTNGATLTVNNTTIDVFNKAKNLSISYADFLGPEFLGSLVTEQETQSTTWDAFKPDPLGVQGISGVFQLNDNIFAVRDFFGGKFVDGVNEPQIGHEVSCGSFTALIGGYELTNGAWEAGDAEGVLYLYPNAGSSTDMDLTETQWTNDATITNDTTGETIGTTVSLGQINYSNKGLLWKKDKERRQGGWSLVDMGYSVRFHEGATAPVASLAPLILTDSVDTISDTGFVDFNVDGVITFSEYPSGGSTDYIGWTGFGQTDSTTPASYAQCAITAGKHSAVMVHDVEDGTVPGDARILGIEVQVTVHQDTGSDVVINKVMLKNEASGATRYMSENRGENNPLNSTPGTTYTFGGQLDKWGFEDITQEDLDGIFTADIQFKNTNVSTTRTVYVDLVQIKVHYATTGQRVYFWNGTTDVDSADLYAYQVNDGDWSSDDAQGWMTVQNLSAPSQIHAGDEIRTAGSGGGDLIATVRAVEKNFLPSMAEMDARNAIYSIRTGTFSGNEDAEAVYVATGASPAFTLDREDRFSFIRLPIDEAKDRPRYVEVHRNHLVLATGSHVLISSVGAPNNFNTYDGATTWSLKDRVTGLANAPNGSTMIACEDSIHILTGSAASGSDPFAVRMYTDNSGARDYTMTSLLGNVFVDWAGLTTADISDKYGGFDVGRKSAHARPTLQQLFGQQPQDNTSAARIIGALPVRRKNQYRVYFSDGEVLTATMPDTQDQPIAFTMQNYTAFYQDDIRGYESLFAPTALSSAVKTNGEESILIGTRLGHVMRVDPNYMQVLAYANRDTDLSERSDALKVFQPFKFLDFNALHIDDPSQLVHWKSCEVYVEHSGYSDLNRTYNTDYRTINRVPVISATEDTVGDYTRIGDSSTYLDRTQDDYFSWYLDEATDGLVLRFSKFGGQSAIPMRISKLFLRVEPKGYGRNSLHESRAYEVKEGVLPVDLTVLGNPIELAIAMGTPSIKLDRTVAGSGITLNITMDTPSIVLGSIPVSFDDTTVKFDSTTVTWDGAS